MQKPLVLVNYHIAACKQREKVQLEREFCVRRASYWISWQSEFCYISNLQVFSLLAEQRAMNRISCDLFLNVMLTEVRTFRDHLQSVVNYDWVSRAQF